MEQQSLSSKCTQRRKFLVILINISTFTVCVVLATLLEKDVIPVHEKGFFCNDISIRYPYREQTVPGKWLFGINLIISICLYCVGEKYIIPRKETCENPDEHSLVSKLLNANHVWYLRSLKLFLSLAWCLAATLMLTSIIKSTVGSLRPHFVSVCDPDIECSSYNMSSYIDEYTCRTTNQHRITDARRSFPSGHASFSAATMAFNILYIEYQSQYINYISYSGQSSTSANMYKDTLLKPFLEICLIGVAVFIAMSRVLDYYHHLIDVLIGFLLGTVMGLLVGRESLKCIHQPPKNISCKPTGNPENGPTDETMNENESTTFIVLK